ncbi:MAG: bifunctional (p)ppGpp synthetase/guanosine-3',5'-bis(diphosphate) 3'-pyrophosphohydrolase [Crenarchaeota archaeon]|nr:MAG: bifunctional (p)ppGpp synthetase/guanosine-3',5'-bis(diphosphate) 3'-pyrophosphohydrolase [Thermoproteota archaeon]RDJ33593.1 MAG: bifunctional (p)ppGpp synthetase/guanosine-3',5'-bis(diphosphate) 3'-pyrophosphohydrolase [Thermoproteota archaeon]RDJ38084.1 MAG: bifunctional (p)ppGpp synthetase/guanosine-3',5'-bis(diphosphate) 3'-pyrophosphohydrolase [Thermoproteota archaeon]RDJ39146.1 MAG: bifunctional (p)ppGpp synthetase/guanosine-3',5'-bis(diphosphate) 3'-pyrophosphohydrolase [Thermopr
MTKSETAYLYAREKHKGKTRADGITPDIIHLEAVVSRLKSLGVTDDDVLCAAWLHDSMESTETTFDDVYERFGQRVAVLVSTLSKDKNLPKKEIEIQYVKQLQGAPFEAKLIKLCDISANLKSLDSSMISKNKRKKATNKMLHYLGIIKNDLIEKKSDYPKIESIIKGINEILKEKHQRPIKLD